MTDPRADGLGVSTCIELALKDSRIEKEQVNYINAHATRWGAPLCSAFRNRTCLPRNSTLSTTCPGCHVVAGALSHYSLPGCFPGLFPPAFPFFPNISLHASLTLFSPSHFLTFFHTCPRSTIVGDVAEVKAVKKVFTDTKHIKMNGTKSMIGHCLGAAGGMEVGG